MREQPLVSVILPAYNAERFIERARASVRARTDRNLEVMVVDDGSQDRTAPLVEAAAGRDARITLLRQPNRGVAAARNRAIAEANGTFIAPLDADDLWAPQKLERQVRCMAETGEATGLVYAWWAAVDEEDAIIGWADRWTVEGEVYDILLFRNFIGNASVPLFRRSCLDRVGGYDPRLRARGGQGCEDWDLTLRIAEHYDVRCVPAYLSGYRDVTGSMSGDSTSMGASYELIVQDIERRRPDLDPDLFRWSRSNFYLYLSSLSYSGGRFRQGLYWLRRVVQIDPSALLAPYVLKTTLKSTIRLATQPATARIWPEHQDWIAFKHRFLQAPRLQLGRLLDGRDGAPEESWAWKPWKPYDRLCMARWRRVMEGEMRRPASSNGQPAPSARRIIANAPAYQDG